MPPTLANREIGYIEMPTTDIARSAEFYKRVFGWNIRKRGDGSTSFDDTVGEVSGTWVTGRPPAARPGLLFYVMVAWQQRSTRSSPTEASACSRSAGDAPEITVRFAIPQET
jgi:uncharacterized protein